MTPAIKKPRYVHLHFHTLQSAVLRESIGNFPQSISVKRNVRAKCSSVLLYFSISTSCGTTKSSDSANTLDLR